MAESPQTLWQNCLGFIQHNLNQQQFQTWFVPTKFKSYDAESDLLTIYVPSPFFYEYIEENFRKLIYAAIIRYFGTKTRLNYIVKVTASSLVEQESDRSPIIESATSSKPANQAPNTLQASSPAQDLDSQLNTKQNFDNFIAGDSNKLPRSVGMAIAEHPNQQTFNPLFIYGPSGVGKTHLVNAIGTRLKQLYPQKRVLYVSAHLFQVQYTDSVRHNTVNDFINFYQSIDTLIIDDVQEFASLKGTQNTFFHIFNHLHQNGRQIILTSDRPPTMLMGMEERMLTRFKWGLIAELEKPEEALRQAILTNKIKHDGLNIGKDVIRYIAENVSESVRELEGVVHSLLANSIVYNKDVVDLEFAKRILKHNKPAIDKRNITLDKIVEETCACCKIRQEDIYNKTRKADIVEARQLSMYLAQKHTTLTISRIGTLLGNRNHATVSHGIKNIENKLKVSNKLQQKLKLIEEKLCLR
ncbi:MAG: chromosomal replication initiator protein DnaA [Bacteroidaceae bacterium]|nr:chromosomal replication initiator protein DnaA [Bacteroidaceae bacterium]